MEGFCFLNWNEKVCAHTQEQIKTLKCVSFIMEHPRTHSALSWDLRIYLRSKTVSNRESD